MVKCFNYQLLSNFNRLHFLFNVYYELNIVVRDSDIMSK